MSYMTDEEKQEAINDILKAHNKEELSELLIHLDGALENANANTADAMHDLHMKSWQERVKEFHKAMGLPAPGGYVLLSEKTRELRCKLQLEETLEFIEASGCRVYQDDEGRIKVHALPDRIANVSEEGQVDGVIDIIYIALGTAVSMGLDLQPFFEEVHRANMDKLGPDGKPIVRLDGKVLKPLGWKAPEIRRLLDEAERVAELDAMLGVNAEE